MNRVWLVLAAVAAFLSLATASAQAYPTRVISAGRSNDAISLLRPFANSCM